MTLARPHVFVLTGDCLRASSATRRTMPFVSQTADVEFRNCYSPGTWTLPAHASLYSRRSPIEHGASRRGDRLHSEQAILPRKARQRGYRTVLCSENPMFSRLVGFNAGVDSTNDSINFKLLPADFSPELLVNDLTPAEIRFLLGELVSRPQRVRNAINLAYGALSYLGSDADPDSCPHHGDRVLSQLSSIVGRSPRRPIFAVTNLLDTHNPHYTAPEARTKPLGLSFSRAEREALQGVSNAEVLFGDARLSPRARAVFGSWSKFYERQQQVYAAQIRYLDALIEDWMRSLDAAVLADSLVVVTGDHGQLFGEEGMVGHHTSLHPNGIGVPLFVKTPESWSDPSSKEANGGPSSRTIETPLSLVGLSKALDGVVRGEISDTTEFIVAATTSEERVVVAADGPTWDVARLRERYGEGPVRNWPYERSASSNATDRPSMRVGGTSQRSPARSSVSEASKTVRGRGSTAKPTVTQRR